MEFIEKHMIEYSCGCKHEIGLPEAKILGSGFWQPTGNNPTKCAEHKS